MTMPVESMQPIRRRGLMLVLSSPSGAGKTTISRRLLDCEPELSMSISVTTRPPRPNEVEGRDYIFVDRTRFEAMLAEAGMLEHAEVFGNYYGTPRGPVETALAGGRDVLFDVDWQGRQQLADAKKQDVVSVFILPPTRDELHRRLRTRAQDSDSVIASRMAKAGEEASHYAEYDYVVVNEDLEESVALVRSILRAERARRERLEGVRELVNSLRAGD